MLTGDWGGSDFVGAIHGHEFNVRAATPLPRVYAVQAFGTVRDGASGALVTVAIRRNRFANIAVWFMRLFGLFLVLGTLVIATAQPTFLVFAAFVAVGVAAMLWLTRERQGDRENLRMFLRRVFPEADLGERLRGS